MNIDLISTFLDLCETHSFNRTANRLGITQSTVSGRIHALERALGCRLLERSRAGTDLTTEGLRFEPHARAIRMNWTAAKQAVRDPGSSALTMRIGIQHDLLGDRAGIWVAALQDAVPGAALYIEGDYSTQMSADVVNGLLDVAVLYSPRPHPDLYFETLGEVTYLMVSTEAIELGAVRSETYILANYASAFTATHAALLPTLSTVSVSSGQNTVIRGLLTARGGSGYVLRDTAFDLERAGQAQRVARAPRIAQPVYAAIHLRARHRGPHRRIVNAFKGQFEAKSA